MPTKKSKRSLSGQRAALKSQTSKHSRPVKVPKAEGAAPVKAYLAALPAWQGRFLKKFDELVGQEVAEAVRAVKWSAPFYGVPGQGWFASTKAFSKHVKITFF